jgi:hypothetical protein
MAQRTPRVVRPKVAPVGTTATGAKIVDFRRNDFSDDEVLGTEALAPQEGAADDAEKPEPGNFLMIRDVRYDLPTLGPLALVIIPNAMQAVLNAQQRRTDLLAAGESEDDAFTKSKLGVVTADFLQLISGLLSESGVPQTVQMTLSMEEVQAIALQFRPFA